MNMVHFRHVSSIVAGSVGFITGIIYQKHHYKFRVSTAEDFDNTVLEAVLNKSQKASSQSTELTKEYFKYGIPSFDNMRVKENFVLSYDNRNKVPLWVLEHLTPDHIEKHENVTKKGCEFVEDQTIHHYFRAYPKDYKDKGYDKGHLAAACNHRHSQQATDETFLLSNIAPQIGKGFNQGAWEKLEEYVRKLVRIHKDVYVYSGPLYLPSKSEDGKKIYMKYEMIGDNHVAVPTHFFKVIVYGLNDPIFKMETYIMENAPIEEDFKKFRRSKNEVERSAGFLLFSKIPQGNFQEITTIGNEEKK